MKKYRPTIMGLDLSLTAPGVCIIAPQWSPEKPTSKYLSTKTLEPPRIESKDDLYGKAERLDWITTTIRQWAETFNVSRVFAENYSYGSNTATAALAELGGCVKRELYTCLELIVQPVASMSARKTLLGTIPSKSKLPKGMKLKEYVDQTLSKCCFKFGSMDEGDAFVIANHGRKLCELSYIQTGAER